MPHHNSKASENTNASPNTTPSETETENDGPGLDEIHDMLSKARRRHVLRTLHAKGAMHKKELARYVAAIENEKDSLDDLTDQERKRVLVSLHQYQLPPLKKNGMIVWDEATNMVSLGPYSDRVLQYMDGITVEDDHEEHAGESESDVDGSVERREPSWKDRVAQGVNSIF